MKKRKFEVDFNLNLFEYSSLSSGTCLRYHWFMIGTDRLSQLASFSDFNSFDIYFGFKINFTELPIRKHHASPNCPAYKAH